LHNNEKGLTTNVSPFFAPSSAQSNFRCRKRPKYAPFPTGRNFRCRKTLFCAPKSVQRQLPVQEKAQICTIPRQRQLPVQENTLLCTKICPEITFGAGKHSFVHRKGSIFFPTGK